MFIFQPKELLLIPESVAVYRHTSSIGDSMKNKLAYIMLADGDVVG